MVFAMVQRCAHRRLGSMPKLAAKPRARTLRQDQGRLRDTRRKGGWGEVNRRSLHSGWSPRSGWQAGRDSSPRPGREEHKQRKRPGVFSVPLCLCG